MEFIPSLDLVPIKKEKVATVAAPRLIVDTNMPPPLVEIKRELIQPGFDVPSAGDYLYEIRKRPDRDYKALKSVTMVLQKQRQGKPVSAIAKKNRERLRILRKQSIEPRVALLRRHQHNMQHAIVVLKKIQTSALKKAQAEAAQGNIEKKKARGGIANQAGALIKAAERATNVVDHYALEYEKIGSNLNNLVEESKKIQNHFEVLTDSVLGWGKNVIQWAPPSPWEFERLPVTLYQLRVHNEMDDPAEKFSTDKKKRAKARAKRKRREQASAAAVAFSSSSSSSSSSSTTTVANGGGVDDEKKKGVTKPIQVVKPRFKKHRAT